MKTSDGTGAWPTTPSFHVRTHPPAGWDSTVDIDVELPRYLNYLKPPNNSWMIYQFYPCFGWWSPSFLYCFIHLLLFKLYTVHGLLGLHPILSVKITCLNPKFCLAFDMLKHVETLIFAAEPHGFPMVKRPGASLTGRAARPRRSSSKSWTKESCRVLREKIGILS